MFKKLRTKIKNMLSYCHDNSEGSIGKQLNYLQRENILYRGDMGQMKKWFQDDTPFKISDDNRLVCFNSSYAEFVEAKYKSRGEEDFIHIIIIVGAIILAWFNLFYPMLYSYSEFTDPDWKSLFQWIGIFSIIAFFAPYFYLRKRWFNKAHLPIRLNRHTQMVHIFRQDGSVTSVPWNKIYFSYYQSGVRGAEKWLLTGYMMDKRTVVDVFDIYEDSKEEFVHQHWAFMNSYMNLDCMQELYDSVTVCLPITKQTETYRSSLQFLTSAWLKSFGIFSIVFCWPFLIVTSILRYCSLKSCTIPKWPQEIEDQCQIASDDPYQKTAQDNPKWMWRHTFGYFKNDEHKEAIARKSAANDKIKAMIFEKAEEKEQAE